MRVGRISEQKEKKYPFINVLIQKYIHFKKEFKMDTKAEASCVPARGPGLDYMSLPRNDTSYRDCPLFFSPYYSKALF